MTRAYVEAEAFDVLPESVYTWRQRDDGSSITQQKAEARDLHDRLAAKREISRMLVGTASHAVVTNWYAKVFRLDLMGYMPAALRADDEYWGVLSADVADLLERAPADIDDHVEARFRIAAWLTAHGDARRSSSSSTSRTWPSPTSPRGTSRTSCTWTSTSSTRTPRSPASCSVCAPSTGGSPHREGWTGRSRDA